MIAAIRAQWLILWRRPLLWSLLVAHVLLLLAYMAALLALSIYLLRRRDIFGSS